MTMKDFDKARELGTDGVLLPYQQRWVGDTSAVKLMEKSRRIGISWAEAADDSLYAASESGGDVWYIGYNLDMAREFINDCASWSRHYTLAASEMEEFVFEDEKKGIAAFRIVFASGHRVTALSSRPTNLRGKQGRVVIDEAAFHDDLEELIKAAMALLIWGGEVRIISTHNGEDNPFNDLVKEVREGKKKYSLHRVDLDDALEDGLYKRICLVLGREWSVVAQTRWRQELIDFYGGGAQEELFCVPSQGGGVFLTRALVEGCMSPDVPVIRLACPEGFAERPDRDRYSEIEAWCEDHLLGLLDALDQKLKHYFGEDFGRTGDLTVITPLARQADLVLKAPFVVELRNTPFKQQEQILFYIVDRLPQFRSGALDARGNGQYLAEVAMQRYGDPRIHQVMLSTEWYRDNMPRYKAAFEDRTLLLPRDSDILDDHRAIKMDKGVAKVPEGYKSKGTDGGQRHGDAAISGALGVFAANAEEYGPAEYEQVASREAVFKEGTW